MSKPLASVIVPTKNSARTLRACLESIQVQTYKNVEILVVDNFSTDETKEIATQYTDKFFECGPERSAQRNFGVEQAQGKYVLFVDSDMKLEKNVLEQCVDRFEKSSTVRAVVIPEESFGVGFWAQCKKLERSFYLGVDWMEAARFFMKKDVVDVGGYNTTLISGEDWDLSFRIAALGTKERVEAFIFHDEGRLSLSATLKKKFFYATKFFAYVSQTKDQMNQKKQTGVVSRYALFFSDPKKLFCNPLLGGGMLFMKTAEFFFGSIGYVWGFYKQKKMV